MKKIFRLMIVSALLLGIFIPIFDFYFSENQTNKQLSLAKESQLRNIAELKRLAKESFYEGNYKGAENYYHKIIALAPFDLKSRRNLAVIYNEENKLEAENKVLLKIAILSNSFQDYLNLAINFSEQSNYQASNYILNNKLEAAKGLDDNFYYKKYYYLIKNNFELANIEKAENYLMKITNLQLNKADLYLLTAKLNKVKENYELAYHNYLQAYQENKTQTYLYKEMALMLERAGREIDAYKHWQKTLAYGWFKDLCYQKINYYQNKYPQLKISDHKDPPQKIDPFSLTPNWTQIKALEKQKSLQILRIGLQKNNKTLLFQYSKPFSIIKSGKIIYRGKEAKNYLIKIENDFLYLISQKEKVKIGNTNSEYKFYSSQPDSSFYVYNINYGQGYFWQGSTDRQYRGNMIIQAAGSKFSLINQVELTPYLISVVPSEIYASWPKEALKAQAVAARSYTLNNLGRHSSEGYDLCDSVHCAAYNGIRSENQRTTAAVLSTQGETAYFDSKIIEAVFSSNSGGVTERSDQIWSADLPYLRGSNQMKNNNYSFPLSPLEFKKWINSSPESYSKDFGESNYRWQLEIPAEVIIDKTEFELIKDIRVKKRALGGTITSLTIAGKDKEKNYSVSQIRRVLGGLKSSRFYFDSHYDQNNNLKSIYIYGSGWGHNLGLDQSAAAGMGAAGYNYQQIIKHFYPGVSIRKID